MMKNLIAILFIIAALTSCSLFGSDDNQNRPDIPGKIVFSAKDDAGTSQIFTMNANGRDVKQLTHFDASEGAYQPSWSPDGTQVAFDLCLYCQIRTNNDIYLFDTQSKKVTQVTQDSASDTNPNWSPNGSRIAFFSDRDYVDADTLRFRKDLYVVNIDDGTEQRVTETGFAREPKWGPQNDVIAFRSTSSSAGLYKVNVSTNAISMIKKDSEERIHLHPQAWASDGSKLLVITRNLNNKESDSLLIVNMKTDSVEKIYTTSDINDADWFIPAN